MSERIDEKTADKWQKIATLLKTAKEAVDEAAVALLVELNVTGGAAATAIHEAQDALAGHSYMFTPQSEWTGGDSMLPNNFKWCKPHITTISDALYKRLDDKDDPRTHCNAG